MMTHAWCSLGRQVARSLPDCHSTTVGPILDRFSALITFAAMPGTAVPDAPKTRAGANIQVHRDNVWKIDPSSDGK
mgnify:CR=1